MRYDAVILTGGTGARLGGVDKAGIEYAGQSLLAHALDAVHAADRVVIVGERVATRRKVLFTRERPRLGGPGAGLLAGRDALGDDPAPWLVALAVDMPEITAATVGRLLQAAVGDGAVLIDPSGRRQLAAVLDPRALDRVRPPTGQESGLPVHRLLGALALREVASLGVEHHDIDTWADLGSQGLPVEPGFGKVEE